MLYIPYLFYSSFECMSARHRNFTRSLYLSFENGCSTLEVVSLDLRYARYDAESIGAKVPAWWKSRKSIKGIEKNWEGFTVSGTRFGGHESVPWQRHLVSHDWNPSQTTSFARSTILCYKEFSSTSSPLFIAWIPNLWAVRPHGRFFTRFRSRICWIRKF